MTDQIREEGKTMAIVSYLTIIGAVIAIIMNSDMKNPFVAFHSRQGLGLCVSYMILGFVISGFNNWMITYAFWIVFFVLFIYGIIGAATKKENSVPIIGDFFQKIFKGIGQ
ncbi:DUF4870 domain-containing protein [Hanstruepera marina]|uniref:DUF4870 domain-containing protein n=1 Tax=Hanstruepera marina TaxID=2873265 RepID=UPI001CA66F10|nr:hypothetical protein [Hanstruepera marina]